MSNEQSNGQALLKWLWDAVIMFHPFLPPSFRREATQPPALHDLILPTPASCEICLTAMDLQMDASRPLGPNASRNRFLSASRTSSASLVDPARGIDRVASKPHPIPAQKTRPGESSTLLSSCWVLTWLLAAPPSLRLRATCPPVPGVHPRANLPTKVLRAPSPRCPPSSTTALKPLL